MRENIGDVLLSEAYPRALFEQVEANDATIRILGEAATLEQVMAGRRACKKQCRWRFGVRRSVRRWCTRQDETGHWTLEVAL